MRIKVSVTSNLKAALRAIESVVNRTRRQPGMAVFHGRPGMGKTTSIAWLANQYDGLAIEAKELWTPRWMLSDFVRELGASPGSRCQEMYEFVARELTAHPRPIFLDEADRLARREVLVETLREIHDSTSAPIILVGMDQFKKRAEHRPQLKRRIVREVEFKPASLDDARMLASELCEIEIQDDLVAELHRRSGGSIGLLCNALAEAEAAAKRTGARVIKLNDYKDEARHA